MHDKRQMKRYSCMWTLIGLEICLEERARTGVIVRSGKTFVETHVMFADGLLHYRAEKLSMTL